MTTSNINISSLPISIIYKLIDDLEPNQLSNIIFNNEQLLNEFRNYIYYKCISSNVFIKNNKYLYETLHIKLPELQANILNITKENNHICIANLFPFQLYFNKDISNFIEIYVLNNSDEHPLIIKSMTELIIKLYEEFNEYETFKINDNSYLLKFESVNIKFNFVPYESLCEVLMSLENPFMRCGFFNDKFYVAPDAKVIKDTYSNINIDIMNIDNNNIKCDDLILLMLKNKIVL